jgi:DNA end-binding protein Ku
MVLYYYTRRAVQRPVSVPARTIDSPYCEIIANCCDKIGPAPENLDWRVFMPSIVWKGQLAFGLVSIPVKLHRAARRERVPLHYVHRAPLPDAPDDIPELDIPASPAHVEPEPRPLTAEVASPPEEESAAPPVSRVHQSLVRNGDQQPIARSEVLRGYEVEPDRYVVFDPDELKALRRRTSPTMEIVRSVRLAEIDPVFFETSYYVVPDRGGEKAYAILFTALQRTGHVALARVGMHGREHVVIVRAGQHGMLAHTMFYTDEIRFENEYRTDLDSVGAKEAEMAENFLQALEAPFAPEEFKDVYRQELQAMIAAKTMHAGTSAAQPQPVSKPPVIDILDALKKSIAMIRKPDASDAAAARKAPGRATGVKSKPASRKVR